MVGEEGRPGKKLKKAVKVKKAERPPANPVVDVSILNISTNDKNIKKKVQVMREHTIVWNDALLQKQPESGQMPNKNSR